MPAQAQKTRPGQIFCLGYNTGRGRRVNSGFEGLCVCAFASDSDRQSYADGVRAGVADRKAAEAKGGE